MSVSKDPELELARSVLNDDPQEAYDRYDSFLVRNPSSTLAVLGKIFALNHMKRWSDARDVANDYIAMAPEKGLSYWSRAEAHYRMGLHSNAIADSAKAIELDKKKTLGTLPYRLIALCHAHLGNLPEALSYADQVEKNSRRDWLAPLGPLPSGTLPQFKQLLTQVAAGEAPKEWNQWPANNG